MSESEFKNCKSQTARPDPYQNEMGDPEVELEVQAPAQVTSRAFLCASIQDHAHRIAQFCFRVRRFSYLECAEISSEVKCTKNCPMKMEV